MKVLAGRPHPEQGFRSCLGILKLFRGVAKERAEAVSAHALSIGALNSRSVASIPRQSSCFALATRIDRSTHQGGEEIAVITHGNIRGSGYFH